MRTHLLFPSLLLGLSALACNVPDTVQFHPDINTRLQPGETGTLLELQDDRHWIDGIVVSENYLFIAVMWAGVYRMPKYGGDIVPLDEDLQAAFYHLGTDGARVYWNHVTFDERDYPYTVVKSQPLDGGPTSIVASGKFGMFSSGNRFKEFHATGDFLYWAQDTGGDTPGQIVRVPAGGGRVETMASFSDAQSVPPWVADASGLYLVSSVVEHVAAPGVAAEVVSTGLPDETFPIGSDANAVFLQPSAGGVWSMSKADGSITKIQVASDDAFLGWAMALDDTSVYDVGWRTQPPTLVRFPKTGGAPTAIADVTGCLVSGGGPAFIAVDPQYVFLVCGDQNRIVIAPNLPAP